LKERGFAGLALRSVWEATAIGSAEIVRQAWRVFASASDRGSRAISRLFGRLVRLSFLLVDEANIDDIVSIALGAQTVI